MFKKAKKKKILLTGGGTGGHIYPLVALAQGLNKNYGERIDVFYLGPKNILNAELEKAGAKILKTMNVKFRRYFSILNFLDIVKFPFAFFQSLAKILHIMPDVVFSKGGPGSFPVLLAAKFYFIPIVIHESDSVPGLTNKLTSFFAKRIAISFETTRKFFPPSKTFMAGIPIREGVLQAMSAEKEEAKLHFGFNLEKPLVLVLGGSQGAVRINDFVTDNIEDLIKFFQVHHQVGKTNLEEIELVVKPNRNYKFFGYLDSYEMGLALKAADIIISRAGATAIYEIAFFNKPVVLIPLPEAAQNHQILNAYEFQKASSNAMIIEEDNLKTNLVISQINKLLRVEKERERKILSWFFKPDAATMISREIISLISPNL